VETEGVHDATEEVLPYSAICAGMLYRSMNIENRISFTLNKPPYYVFSSVKQSSETLFKHCFVLFSLSEFSSAILNRNDVAHKKIPCY
jgi:hypothetical protein